MPFQNKITHFAINAVLFGSIQFFILSIIAMIAFPGGTIFNSSLEHYSFFENFFSDLGRTIDFEGNSNWISMVLFSSSLSILGVCLILFFTCTSSIFAQDKKTKIVILFMAIIGIGSGIGFIGIAFTPWDLGRPIHELFVNIGFRLLLLAIIFLIAAIFRTKTFPRKAAHVLIFICCILLMYILLISLGPKPEESKQALIIQAASQKLIAYVLIFGIAYVAFIIKKNISILEH